MIRNMGLKVVVSILAIVFTFDSLGLSQVILPNSGRALPSVTIPNNLGTIDEYNQIDSNRPLLIHIQDAHANYSAQKNIKNILAELKETQDIDFVFVEGASGFLDAKHLQFTDDSELNRRVAEHLARLGEFTAADLYLSEYGNQMKFLGIENTLLYKENINYLKQVYSKEENIFDWVLEAKEQLLSEVTRLNNKGLLQLMRIYFELESENPNLSRVLKTLNELSVDKIGRDLREAKEQVSFPNLVRFLRLMDQEGNIQVKTLEKEWSEIKGLLEKSNQLSLEGLDVLVEEVLFENNQQKLEKSKYSFRFLLEHLYASLEVFNFDFNDYPQFKKLARQFVYEEELNGREVFDEIDRWVDLLFNHVAKQGEELAVVHNAKLFQLIEKLLLLKLNRQNWLAIQNDQKGVSTFYLLDEKIKPLIESAVLFYQFAEAREHAFIKTIKKNFPEDKQFKAVIITGGFHSKALRESFRENEWNYVGVSPKIQNSSNQSYIKTILGRHPEDIETSQAMGQAYAVSAEVAKDLGVEVNSRSLLLGNVINFQQRGMALETENVSANSLGKKKKKKWTAYFGFGKKDEPEREPEPEESPLIRGFMEKDANILTGPRAITAEEPLIVQVGERDFYYVSDQVIARIDEHGNVIERVNFLNVPLRHWENSFDRDTKRGRWAVNEREILLIEQALLLGQYARILPIKRPKKIAENRYELNVRLPRSVRGMKSPISHLVGQYVTGENIYADPTFAERTTTKGFLANASEEGMVFPVIAEVSPKYEKSTNDIRVTDEARGMVHELNAYRLVYPREPSRGYEVIKNYVAKTVFVEGNAALHYWGFNYMGSDTDHMARIQEPTLDFTQALKEASGETEKKYLIELFVRRMETLWEWDFVDHSPLFSNWGFNQKGNLVLTKFRSLLINQDFEGPLRVPNRKRPPVYLKRKIQFFVDYVLNNTAYLYQIDPELAKLFYQRVAATPFGDSKKRTYFINEILASAAREVRQAYYPKSERVRGELIDWETHWQIFEREIEKIIGSDPTEYSQIVERLTKFFEIPVKRKRTEIAAMLMTVDKGKSDKVHARGPKRRIIERWRNRFQQPYEVINKPFSNTPYQEHLTFIESYINLLEDFARPEDKETFKSNRGLIRGYLTGNNLSASQRNWIEDLIKRSEMVSISGWSEEQVRDFRQLIKRRQRLIDKGIKLMSSEWEFYVGSDVPQFQLRVPSRGPQRAYHFLVTRTINRKSKRVMIYDYSDVALGQSRTRFKIIRTYFEAIKQNSAWQELLLRLKPLNFLQWHASVTGLDTQQTIIEEAPVTRVRQFSPMASNVLRRANDAVQEVQARQFFNSVKSAKGSTIIAGRRIVQKESSKEPKPKNVVKNPLKPATPRKFKKPVGNRTRSGPVRRPKRNQPPQLTPQPNRRRVIGGNRRVNVPLPQPSRQRRLMLPYRAPKSTDSASTLFRNPSAVKTPPPTPRRTRELFDDETIMRGFPKPPPLIRRKRSPPSRRERRRFDGQSLGKALIQGFGVEQQPSELVSSLNIDFWAEFFAERQRSLLGVGSVTLNVADRVVSLEELELPGYLNFVLRNAEFQSAAGGQWLRSKRQLFQEEAVRFAVVGDKGVISGVYEELFGQNDELSIAVLTSSELSEKLIKGIVWALINQKKLIVRIINDGKNQELLKQLNRTVPAGVFNQRLVSINDLGVTSPELINRVLRDRDRKLYDLAKSLDPTISSNVDITERIVVWAHPLVLESVDQGLFSKVIAISSDENLDMSQLYQWGIVRKLAANEGRLSPRLREDLRLSGSGVYVFMDQLTYLRELSKQHHIFEKHLAVSA